MVVQEDYLEAHPKLYSRGTPFPKGKGKRRSPTTTHSTRSRKYSISSKKNPRNTQKINPGRFRLTKEHLLTIARQPHLLGHMVGKTKLTELHSKWIWEVWGQPSGTHTALMAHRGAYKTTAITELGCLWWLLFHPQDRICLIRETFTAANDTLKTIKAYLKVEAIQALFKLAHGSVPKTSISRDGTVTYAFKKTITKEGSIDAHGIEQVPTGSHYDRIICDDIVTINSRLSKAKRERVKEGVREIITNIIDPGKSVHIIGTPWHHDDAWAMKNEDGDLIIPEPYKYRPADTNILSDAELEAKRKTTSKAEFAINYMLDTSVRDDGQIFDDEPIRGEWNASRPAVDYFAHLDAKFDGDCTNALTIMCRLPSGQIQAIGWTFEDHIEKKVDWVLSTLLKYRCNKLLVETNPDKGFVAKMFRKRKGRMPLTVIAYHEDMNKHHKIVTYLKHYWHDIIWASATQPEYLLQIVDYRQGQDPMDCPDSAASLLRKVFFATDKLQPSSNLNSWGDD